VQNCSRITREPVCFERQRLRRVDRLVPGLIQAGATTLQQIADALNDRGVATARGGSWYPSNVRNVLARG
jgi:recombinase